MWRRSRRYCVTGSSTRRVTRSWPRPGSGSSTRRRWMRLRAQWTGHRAMGDPHVRAVGEVEDAGTHPLAVGVDYDTVPPRWRGGGVWRGALSAAEEGGPPVPLGAWAGARDG